MKVIAKRNHILTTLQPTELAPAVETVIRSNLSAVTLQPVLVPHGGTQFIISGSPEALSSDKISESKQFDLNNQISSLSESLHLPIELIHKANELSFVPLNDFYLSLDVSFSPQTAQKPKVGALRDSGGTTAHSGGPFSTRQAGLKHSSLMWSAAQAAQASTQIDQLAQACVTETFYRADGTYTVLTKPEELDNSNGSAESPACKVADWATVLSAPTATLTYDDAPIFLVQVDGRPSDKGECAYVRKKFNIDFGQLFEETCQVQYLLARSQTNSDQLMWAMELGGSVKTPMPDRISRPSG